MAVSISDFKTWAGANRNTAVAVKNGALESASNQIGVIDLIFRRGTVDSVRSAVMKDFTRALSARYGVSIAQQAISKAGLSANSELTGKTISEVVASAKKLRADMLRPVGAKDIRLGDATIEKSQFKDLGPDDRKMLTKFLKQRAVAVELQSAWAERFAGLLAEAQEQSGDEPGEDGGDVEDGENDADHKDSDFIIKA